jgi:hypothetical protein
MVHPSSVLNVISCSAVWFNSDCACSGNPMARARNKAAVPGKQAATTIGIINRRQQHSLIIFV